jgi:hypothetical protein
MRIVPFPAGHDDEGAEQAWLAELESALSGAAQGPAADSWRELREDVRSLAPAMSVGFERELWARILERETAGRRPRPRLRLARPGRPAIGAIAAVFAVAVVALVVVAPWRGARGQEAVPALSRPTSAAPAAHAGASEAAAPGRVQELGASVTLAVTPAEVQETADRVSRLVVRDGGFVQSSHVQVQQGHGGEATLTLKLPSDKLSAALASLEQIAPVRDESQSLQDITNSYNSARQRLSDADAERQALLHALAKASTEGEIDSLRERLAQSRSAVASAHAALEAVLHRASTAEVEVSVLGDAHAGSEGLTLHRGLHDAGRVLTVALVVLLIALAVVVPLALVLLALVGARRVWRRHQREQALDTSS